MVLDWLFVLVCELLFKLFFLWGLFNIVRLCSNVGRFFLGIWLLFFLIELWFVIFIVYFLRVLWFRVYVDSVENLCLNLYICYFLIFIGEVFIEFFFFVVLIVVWIVCGLEIELYVLEFGYLWLRDMNYIGGSLGNLIIVSWIVL